jgi:hypothetical protein
MGLGSVVRFWGAADYEPSLRIFDKICQVADHVKTDDEHWLTDRLSVKLASRSEHTILTLAHSRVAFEGIHPPDLTLATKSMATRVFHSLDRLEIQSITRMGLKVIVYKDIGLEFDALLAGLKPLCLSTSDDFVKLTSDQVKDVQLVVDYERDGSTIMLRSGPMRHPQGISFLSQTGEHTQLFPDVTEADDLTKLYAAVPEVFLYLDADVFSRGAFPRESWSSFVDSACAEIMRVFGGLENMILENAG